MNIDKIKNCQGILSLNGEVYLAIYPVSKVIFIDFSHKGKIHKSFFCDFMGNIICPQQINHILKKNPTQEKLSCFFNNNIKFIFMNSTYIDHDLMAGNIYINLNSSSENCIMKILYSSGIFSLGVIEKELDQEISECLKLIPKDLKNWRKMIIKGETFSLYLE